VTGGTAAAVLFREVARRASPGDCVKLGMVLAEHAPRAALLAMGDACARPAREAPGVPDPAAQEYDEEIAEALAAVDARWLARLDPALDDELVVAGRVAWQVLAGAARGSRLDGRLLCMTAPYGVTYLVASWAEARTD
jgi:aromatic ring-opening dioxygenase LigB subunit